MYELLIVDDEKTIRDGLCSVIKWEELGFHVACVAEDGKSALQLLQHTAVDVILTDIQMPELSGLDMAKTLRKANFPIKLVIISGYSNFEYAMESISLHVEAFILKPIDPQNVCAVFSELKQRLDQERQVSLALVHAQEMSLSGKVVDTDACCKRFIACIESAQQSDLRKANDAFFMLLSSSSPAVIKTTCLEVLTQILDYFQIESDSRPRALQSALNPSRHDVRQLYLRDIEDSITIISQNAEQTAALLCSRAKQTINCNYAKTNLSLRLISKELNISYGYLSSIFTKRFQINPKAYLIRVRMEKARELLLQRKLRMYEIASAVGYTNSRYFSDAFRKYFGMPPSQYLKNINQNEGGSEE